MSSPTQDPSVPPRVPPEAELESRIAAALHAAFPNIPRNDIVHQRWFKVRLGHEPEDMDTAALWEKSGRADIIVFYKDRALAVLELKRQNLELTHEDYEQAQSYANQLTPRPPLVIVSNGRETRVFDSSSGARWSDGGDAAGGVSRLIENAAKLAVADMRWTIDALMGRETGVWERVVREQTQRYIDALTNERGASGKPFAKHLLIPRIATRAVLQALREESHFVIVEGAPLLGKTNVLRELANLTRESNDFAALMVRGWGVGLFQALSNLFAAKLEWNITPQDVRQWVRRLSFGKDGPALLLLVDGVAANSAWASDLEELAAMPLGKKVRIVISTDDADALIRQPNTRGVTAVGDSAVRVEVGPLSHEEFKAAAAILAAEKVRFESGAQHIDDYRAPWLLRTLYDHAHRSTEIRELGMSMNLPTALGFELLDIAREMHAGNVDTIRGYRVLARSALEDNARPAGLALAAAHAYLVRQDALSDEARGALPALRSTGAVRLLRHTSGEDIVVPTIPEAFMLELAEAASEQLELRAQQNPFEAGIWLGERMSATYLGDMVGAQALRSLAEKQGGLSSGLFGGLASIEPAEDRLKDGIVATQGPDGRVIYLKVTGDQMWFCDRQGKVLGGPIGLDEDTYMYANVTPWMVLGQVARLPLALAGDEAARLDPALLAHVGQCRFPLLRVTRDQVGHFVHSLGKHGRVLCSEQGAIEPVTQAMAEMLSRPWSGAQAWVDECIATRSAALLSRLHIALKVVGGRRIASISEWVATAHDQVGAALRAVLAENPSGT